MKRNLGILLPARDSAFAAMPLLGKPCRAHVEQALTDAGITATAAAPETAEELRALLAKDVASVLLVAENAPCLNAVTYCALAVAAEKRPAAVLLPDMTTPLAMAFPAETLRTLSVKGALTFSALTSALDGCGEAVKVVHAQSPDAYVTVTDAESFAAAYRFLRDAIVRKHVANGVVVLDPERTVIEADVRIGAGTVLYAGNTLQGGTVIGANCTLYPNNRMDGAALGDCITVESSVLLHCSVGAHTKVGPFAYLRPDAAIGEGCRIGDFVEIKNSIIGDGTKVSHLTYVGDSDLGKNINLGCGVVFVNYDGKVKNRSTVEDDAFIGCNCNLISPVHIGKGAYLAAGSTVVSDVPEDALFVARARGVVKEDWVKRRKEQGKL
jgi:bifunctional UDP-N-acetylglucosamine pyrophosphorylase / glucosamine-1-phosphate N-acetyltransferase